MHRLRTLLMTLLLAASGAGAWAQNLSMEEKLSAIRKSLVETALEGPTKVTATQWIDAQGVLRESSSFRSGVEVRGVRVIGYTTDSDGQASANLQWQDSAAKGLAKTAGAGALAAPGSCKSASAGRMQHVLGVQWNVNGRFTAEEQNMIEELRGHWLKQLSSTGATASVWRVTTKPRSDGRSGYEQALLGAGIDDLPWLLDLTVVALPRSSELNPGWTHASDRPPMLAEESARAAPRVNWGFNMPAVRVELQMRLLARNQVKPVLLLNTPLTLIAQDASWGVTQLSNGSRAQAQQHAQNNALELYKTMACQTVVGEVTQALGKQFRINLGGAAGVRVGDTWVLGDAAKLQQRPLEPGNTEQTVMARVQYVTEHYAQLVPTAGSAQSVKTGWAAWAAEDAP